MTDPRATSFGQASGLYEHSRPSYPAEAVSWLAGDAAAIVDVASRECASLLDSVARLLATHPDLAGRATIDVPHVTYAFRAMKAG